MFEWFKKKKYVEFDEINDSEKISSIVKIIKFQNKIKLYNN